MRVFLTSAAILISPALLLAADPPKSSRPVKVFILSGQSNMEGKARVSLAEYQAGQPGTRELLSPWRQDGKWINRDDVWIKFLNRKGKLTVGYGSPNCIGPELGFGQVVGDRYSEPVLLIKTAWGGRSLYRDFRPPSAGFPSDKVLEKMLADLKKRKGNENATLADVKKSFGASYRAMIEEVNGTLADIKKVFPEYDGRGYELAGLVWFQGWNDMINADATAEYATNFAHFIRDVRKDLKAPKLPIVIGQMGVDGEKASGGVKKFKDAQAAVMQISEFQGTVKLVKTDVYWDKEADAVFRKGWRNHVEEWNKVGSDFPYHYLGSVKTMIGIGRAFGNAVLELRGEKK